MPITPTTHPNAELIEMVRKTGLTQAQALTAFNKDIGLRTIKESSWKAYFCDPATTRFRRMNADLLEHARKVFGPLAND